MEEPLEVEEFCRLCLSVLNIEKEYLDLDSNIETFSIIQSLLPGMKPSPTNHPKACFDCYKKVQMAVGFKQLIQRIKNDILRKLSVDSNTLPTNSCRLCFKVQTNRDNVIGLNGSHSGCQIRAMVEIAAIPINFEAADNGIICSDCWSKVKDIYNFIKNCFNSDKHLQRLPGVSEQNVIKNNNCDKECPESQQDLNEIKNFIKHEDDNFIELHENLLPDLVPLDSKKLINVKIEEKEIDEDDVFEEDLGTLTVKTEGVSETETKYNIEQLCREDIYIKQENAFEDMLLKDMNVYVPTTSGDNTESQSDVPLRKIKQEILDIKGSDSHNLDDRLPPYKCDQCQFETYKNELYYQHIKAHSDNTVCDICHMTFKFKNNLKRHMLVHSEKRNYTCNICQKSFKKQYDLKSHLSTHCSTEDYICHICQKRFKVKKYLKNHIEFVHAKEANFVCDLCGKRFKSAYTLKLHSNSHSTQRKFKCDICHKDYKTLGDLKKHKVVHQDERNFHCNICPKAFKYNKHLKSHMACHNDRNFMCNICEKSFKTSTALKSHMDVHVSNNNFFCEVCEEGFRLKKQFKTHLELAHSKEAIELDIKVPVK